MFKLKSANEMTKNELIGLKNNIDIVKLSKDIEYLTNPLDHAYENKRRRHTENGKYF